MRRLRVLTVIPLVAGLLFAGAATTAAQSGAPVIPGVPSVNLPYVDAGFPCFFPKIKRPAPAPTSSSQDFPVTDDSFVFLMPSTQAALPGLPGAQMGQGMDLSFMKCFFHYDDGTVLDAPYMAKDFRCSFGDPYVVPAASSQPQPFHVFEHSMLIVRDEFAILMCWGTSTCQVQVGTNSQTCCDVATVANEPQICPPTQGSSTTSAARRTALAAARPASRAVDRRLR